MVSARNASANVSEVLSKLQDNYGRFKTFEDVNHAGNRYFQVSSKTVFETQLLQDISSNIWVSKATFQSRA